MLVVVEKMHGHLLLTQKVEERAVGIDRAKDVQILDTFDRQVFGRLLEAVGVGRHEFEGVVAARHPAGIEEVVGFFHGW